MFRILFYTPEIPGNTGNAIRLAAVTGAQLHLVEPLGFDFEDSKLRRAGLDYHDLAVVTVHKDLESAWAALTMYTDVAYEPGDVLLFGPESVGLPTEVKQDAHVTATVRLPMLEARRSLNLANSASIALYEAWRQHGFAGTGTGAR